MAFQAANESLFRAGEMIALPKTEQSEPPTKTTIYLVAVALLDAETQSVFPQFPPEPFTVNVRKRTALGGAAAVCSRVISKL